MKITIIADVLGKENNGTTITITRLIDNLRARGHEVRVVAPEGSGHGVEYPLPKINFHIFNKYIAKNGVELAHSDLKILTKAIYGADIVHIVMPFSVGIKSAEIAEYGGIPITTAFHCQPENITSHIKMKNFMPANNLVYKIFYEFLYKKSNHVHCPSQFIANELKKHHYNMKLHVISNGVDPVFKKTEVEKPNEFKDKYCIMFSGRLSHEKRHDLLINAVKQSKYCDRIQLIFTGCGPLEHEIIKQGENLKNPPIIKFCSKEKLVEIINYCDLYCHPSDIEIEAISCLEAITCGLVPIISDSKRSATNDFALSDKCLFKHGNPRDLAKKIDYMIEHPEEVQKLSEEYVKYSEQFQIDNCITKMEEMFQEAIEENKAKKVEE